MLRGFGPSVCATLRICACVCVAHLCATRVRAHMRACMRTCVRACVRACVHTCEDACVHGYTSTRMHPCIGVGMRRCMCACMQACAVATCSRVPFVCGYMHACMGARMHEHMLCVHACGEAEIQAGCLGEEAMAQCGVE